jgi:hypothetical protein
MGRRTHRLVDESLPTDSDPLGEKGGKLRSPASSCFRLRYVETNLGSRISSKAEVVKDFQFIEPVADIAAVAVAQDQSGPRPLAWNPPGMELDPIGGLE